MLLFIERGEDEIRQGRIDLPDLLVSSIFLHWRCHWDVEGLAVMKWIKRQLMGLFGWALMLSGSFGLSYAGVWGYEMCGALGAIGAGIIALIPAMLMIGCGVEIAREAVGRRVWP